MVNVEGVAWFTPVMVQLGDLQTLKLTDCTVLYLQYIYKGKLLFASFSMQDNNFLRRSKKIENNNMYIGCMLCK